MIWLRIACAYFPQDEIARLGRLWIQICYFICGIDVAFWLYILQYRVLVSFVS